ncbi:plastocyanin/azurin family copper-binding protein [Arcicella rigui]|uniref:Plastocyanin/azurin family copper-binding protein n=1 Tax=Arcicella rigui TaxID=797020 RepID=A0ABU5Q8M1_9BACT|nr:plastocyanin/azurin family copper-binding protein [Arcicella rigui]MEA5139195.1 plastocyanin/azurin family copper-binding protein [Arcicella rigui]
MIRLSVICTLLLMSLKSFSQKDTTITVKILGGLQFDLPRFAVQPNTRLTIILDNHDDMAHNMVVTKPNARLKVVEEAMKLGDKGATMDYVPNSPLIIANTKILEPGRIDTITFTLEKEGIYPYVCTYPGHGFVMYGAIYATNKALPPLEKDINVPEAQRQKTAAVVMNHAGHHAVETPPSPHPFPVKYPLLYRTFMPDCGPAAIAVGLTETEAYCFDAGKCYLRYAWSGGFVDNSEQWKGNGSKLTKVIGEVYWRDKTGFPFRIANVKNIPTVDFKGYQLKKRLPTFKYLLDKVEVTETIRLSANGTTLIRDFTFKNNKQKLYFLVNTDDGIVYQSKLSKFNNGVLSIPANVQRLSISMKR